MVEQGLGPKNLQFGVPRSPELVLGWVLEAGLDFNDFASIFIGGSQNPRNLES